MREKISEYADFIQKVLRPELKLAQTRYQNVKKEIQEYKELKQRILLQQQEPEYPEPLVGDVDLGFKKTIYCRAVAKDLSKIFVHVGMGFHVELSEDEAIDFVSKRISFLETNHLAARQQKMQEVSLHFESAEMSLRQLATEVQRNF